MRRYDAPIRIFGRRFFRTLRDDLREVWDRLLNLERFIVFQAVILQRSRHVTASHGIRQRIEKRLDAWEDSKHVMLIKNTLRTCAEYLNVA